MHALAINRHILVPHFGHLASLVWAKLILGRFRDAVLPNYSRFPAGSDDYLNYLYAFFTDPRHGRHCGRYVPGAKGLCAFSRCFVGPETGWKEKEFRKIVLLFNYLGKNYRGWS